MNNDLGSVVMRFTTDFQTWLRHSGKLLANRLTRDPKVVIHSNSCISLYIFLFGLEWSSLREQDLTSIAHVIQRFWDVKFIVWNLCCPKWIQFFERTFITYSTYCVSSQYLLNLCYDMDLHDITTSSSNWTFHWIPSTLLKQFCNKTLCKNLRNPSSRTKFRYVYTSCVW